MPDDTENVCLLGKTGSGEHRLRTTLLTICDILALPAALGRTLVAITNLRQNQIRLCTFRRFPILKPNFGSEPCGPVSADASDNVAACEACRKYTRAGGAFLLVDWR
jgi:hypothetical protein